MRIAINCRSILTRQPTGIGRYTCDLLRHLAQIDSVNQYELYARLKLFDSKRCLPKITGKNFKLKPDYFNRGPQKTLGNPDVYHAPSPELLDIRGCKIVVTVHDLIYRAFEEGHTPETVKTSDLQFKDIIARADRIICSSMHTRHDLHRFFTLPETKSCVVYQGVDPDKFYRLAGHESAEADAFLKRKAISQEFILFVGTIERRKNLANLLKAFAVLIDRQEFAGQLVIVGMKGWMNDDLLQLADELKIRSRVFWPGFVSDQELRFLYNKARVFVFPSLYEGFGFPILEAMSCGAPVVTSNGSSCVELAADAAVTIDPLQPENIADAISKINRDENFRDRLVALGLKRSKEFCFLKTAQATLKVYEEVVGAI